MLAEDVEHYLCEVARVLKTGGRCPISFFLLNESSLTLMRANNSTINLNINFGSCWVADASDPEAVTGYEEDFVRAVYDRYNFEIKEPIDYGAWLWKREISELPGLDLCIQTHEGIPEVEMRLRMGPSASLNRRVRSVERTNHS